MNIKDSIQINKTKYTLQSTVIVTSLAVFCCLLWGSAFPCIKLGYRLFEIPSGDTASQILFAGVRFSLAGILTILAGSLIQKKFLVPKKESLFSVLKLSLFQTVLQYVFFYIGLAHTTGVKGSIVNAVNVFFSILVSCLLFRLEKLDRKKFAGCIIGFIGVVIVNLGGSFEMKFNFLGDGFLMISAFAYALSTVLIKIYGKKENPVVLSGYQFFIGGLMMVAAGASFGGKIAVATVSGLLLLSYMAFISAGAYTIWSLLLKYNPVSRVAVFGFCTPVFGVILSAILLGEQTGVQLKTVVALLFVCAGIVVVNYKKATIINNL